MSELSGEMRACEARDVGALAGMLARAFEGDAAYRYLMPDASTREAGLRQFFEGNLRLHLAHRCTHVMVDAEGGLMATVTLRPPRGIAISPLTMLRHGLIPFALAHGIGAVKRMLWLKETYDAVEQQTAQGRPHWYVHMMAVRPDLQGKGLGGRLLRHVLDDAARTEPDCPTVLGTHLPINVTYYQRAGFQVSDERTLTPPGSSPYTLWSMRKA